MQAVEFNVKFSDMMKSDSFIARSDYKDLISIYQATSVFFENSQKAKTLTYYCKQNKVDEKEIEAFIFSYNDIKDLTKGIPVWYYSNEKQ